MEHIILACLVLTNEQYIMRYDSFYAQLQFNKCKEMRVKSENKHWYGHLPKSVETSHEGKVTLLWNRQVRTDRTITNNKLDITIHGNKKGTCMLIDVAIPGDKFDQEGS